MKKLRCRLGEVLISRGMTQAQLAKTAGLNAARVCMMIQEKHAPSVEAALMIAEALNMPVGEVWMLSEVEE